MRVELALFEGDTLLERGEVVVSATQQVDSFELFRASHRLGPEAVDIILDAFADHMEVKRSTLSMPVHESGDWESIDLGKYTLAFWCHLDA